MQTVLDKIVITFWLFCSPSQYFL